MITCVIIPTAMPKSRLGLIVEGVKYLDAESFCKKDILDLYAEETYLSGEDIVVEMLKFIGEDPNRKGLIDTPKRIVKMWKETLWGYDENNKPTITTFENGEDGLFYNDLLIDSGPFNSFCEHHWLSFWGRYFIGYIPDKKVAGLSKFGRVVDYFAARLQMAERLIRQVADFLYQELEPKGVIIIMEANHLCKEIRGVEKPESPAAASAVRGCFVTDSSLKQEFFASINLMK